MPRQIKVVILSAERTHKKNKMKRNAKKIIAKGIVTSYNLACKIGSNRNPENVFFLVAKNLVSYEAKILVNAILS